MKWGNKLLLALNVALALGLGFALWFRDMPAPAVGQWDYSDLITTLLTVVTVVLGAIAVLIGIAAIWGYQTISNHAEQKAVEAATSAGRSYLDSDAFTELVRGIALHHVQNNLPALKEARQAIEPETAPPVEATPDTRWED